MFPWYFQLQPEGEILVVVVIVVIAPKKPRGFRTLMSTFHHFFTIIKFVHTIFFFFFINHRQLLQSVVKDKHPFLKKKKKLQECIYWISKENKNVTCDWVIFHYRVQLSFVFRNVFYVCLIQKQITIFFCLYKFHDCRIMQLLCFRKLEMFQATKTIHIDVKILHFPHFIHHSKGIIILL